MLKEAIMDVEYAMEIGRCDARVEELRAAFGSVLADRIVEAEVAEFLWECRVRERYLGESFGNVFDDERGLQELSRVAVLSVLAGRFHVALCLVDGEGMAIELVWKRFFECRKEAEAAFERAN
jgi:hypothetical protein